MGAVVLQRVSKIYPREVAALSDVSLEIADGELLVVVGPSGCGKSTLLRIIAGLEAATSGTVFIGDRDVSGMPTGKRNVAMVFQGATNFPHMSVRQNLSFGMRVRRAKRPERERRVEEVARVLGLGDLLDRRPAELSGGERQRVAIGRAMLRDPDVFLMDEPLSNLDAQLRVEMRREIARLQRVIAATTVFVTHDQAEAMTMGDRVAILRDGRIEQVDRPQDLYDNPRTTFVASFVGTPPMNLFPVGLDARGAHVGPHELPVAPAVSDGRAEAIIGIRADDLLDAELAPTEPALPVEVELVEHLGSEVHVTCRIVGTEHRVVARRPRDSGPPVGQRLCLAVPREKLQWFDFLEGTAID